jgi:hypothetical protein
VNFFLLPGIPISSAILYKYLSSSRKFYIDVVVHTKGTDKKSSLVQQKMAKKGNKMS